MESFDQWLDKQLWSEAIKAEAREVNQSLAERNLNPFTRAQWINWAKARGVIVTR